MTTTIDSAGAFHGGAARFMSEFESFLISSALKPHVIGRGKHLSPRWLVRRELLARRSSRTIALNNAAFCHGKEKIVLLRNALHFLLPAEVLEAGPVPPSVLHLQVPVIRKLASHADLIIAPSTNMAERVSHFLPGVASRIEVRFHPISTPPGGTRQRPRDEFRVLMPIIKAPYKHLEEKVALFLAAIDGVAVPVNLLITADPSEYPEHIRRSSRVVFLGRLSKSELEEYWNDSSGVYFPNTLESFGYALAEARAAGKPVISVNSDLAREVGAQALCPFDDRKVASLSNAIEMAVHARIEPDPSPFSPKVYFDRLLEGSIQVEAQKFYPAT